MTFELQVGVVMYFVYMVCFWATERLLLRSAWKWAIMGMLGGAMALILAGIALRLVQMPDARRPTIGFLIVGLLGLIAAWFVWSVLSGRHRLGIPSRRYRKSYRKVVMR